ncbi:hypothetical protein Tco_0154109 [Tanacetum coccineum]
MRATVANSYYKGEAVRLGEGGDDGVAHWKAVVISSGLHSQVLKGCSTQGRDRCSRVACGVDVKCSSCLKAARELERPSTQYGASLGTCALGSGRSVLLETCDEMRAEAPLGATRSESSNISIESGCGEYGGGGFGLVVIYSRVNRFSVQIGSNLRAVTIGGLLMSVGHVLDIDSGFDGQLFSVEALGEYADDRVLGLVMTFSEAYVTSISIRVQYDYAAQCQDQGIFDSGCSRHMTRNKSYFIDYQDIDGGFVAFAGSPKRGKLLEKVPYKRDDDAELDSLLVQQKEGYANSTNRDSTASQSVSTSRPSINTASENINNSSPNINTASPIPNDSSMQYLENTGIFDDAYDDREWCGG